MPRLLFAVLVASFIASALPAAATPIFSGGTIQATTGFYGPLGTGVETNSSYAPGSTASALSCCGGTLQPRADITVDWVQDQSITLAHEATWRHFGDSSNVIILQTRTLPTDPIQMVLSAQTELALDLAVIGSGAGNHAATLDIRSVAAGNAVVASTGVSIAMGTLADHATISLGPGTYTLYFAAGGSANSSDAYTDHLDIVGSVSVIPEPSTGLLVSVGLLGLASRRRSLRS